MSGKGIQQTLAELVNDRRSWVRIGVIKEIDTHKDWGHLVTVELQPDGAIVQCRVMWWGSGDGYGAFFPIKTGEEVLVLLSAGDINQGIALAGLTSRPAKPPESFDNEHVLIEYPGGIKLRLGKGTLEKLVKEGLLDALLPSLTELTAPCLAFGMPTTKTAEVQAQLPTQVYRTQATESE